MDKSTAKYEAHKKRMRERQQELSRAGRDIGAIPDIVNVRRRARCRDSLRLFCETYNPAPFSLAWSDDHLRVIARIEEAATRGALFAFAMPRGSGKSTISRMAALWAISYAHCRYVFLIGANAGKAQEALDSIKKWIRFLDLYVADFPEIAHPVVSLAGIAHRAAGQICGGESTMLEWSEDRVILPTVPTPANWPKRWPKRDDGKAPTSGAVIASAGLTSDGIRGSLLTLTTGETIRPDLVLLDDPQTPESASSPAQNVQRERLISADVLGMAGPGRTISAVMPCTVIQPNDMIDRILDRKKHPLWRGERTQMLRSMPSNLAAWDRYFAVYAECAQAEPPDYARAHAYYREHRVELELGAEASWPERKHPDDVSAIQHAMHLHFRDPIAFAAEYQNAPKAIESKGATVQSADAIAGRLNRHARGLVPGMMSRLTAFVDVQQDLLFWAVCAWGEDFGGAIVDYGVWPEQDRAYFTLRDARPTLAQVTGVAGLEGSIYAGLDRLAGRLLGRAWPVDAGGELRIERCAIDANWGLSTEVVYRWCRQSTYSALVVPSHGKAIGASAAPMDEWARREGARYGLGWVMPTPKAGRVRHLVYDVHHWKTFAHTRLALPMGERGALTLFGERADVHRLFADHLTAEYPVEVTGRGRTVQEWRWRPHRPDNHWLDCLVGCFVVASVLGVQPLAEMHASDRVRATRVKWSEIQRQKMEARRRVR